MTTEPIITGVSNWPTAWKSSLPKPGQLKTVSRIIAPLQSEIKAKAKLVIIGRQGGPENVAPLDGSRR